MSIYTPGGDRVKITAQVTEDVVEVESDQFGGTALFNRYDLRADGGQNEIDKAIRTVHIYTVDTVQADEPSQNSVKPMTGEEIGRFWPWALAALQSADLETLIFVADLTKVTITR